MRHLVQSLCVLLGLTATFSGQTAEWKTYKNAVGGFSVLLPGEPKDTVNQGAEPGESHTILATEKPAGYMVVYATMPAAQPVTDATYEIYKKAVFDGLPKCEVSKDGPAAPAIQDYIGHWYRLDCDMPNGKITMIGNLYWGKHYAYAVMAIFPANGSEPVAARKFLNSFSVVNASK